MDAVTILGMTVASLKEKLQEAELSVRGRKSELRDRLLRHYNLLQNEDQETDNESSYEIATAPAPQTVVMRPAFTLKDIQDSLPSFTGTDTLDVREWIREFEDNAITLGWN